MADFPDSETTVDLKDHLIDNELQISDFNSVCSDTEDNFSPYVGARVKILWPLDSP